MKYFRRNFLRKRDFRDLADLDTQAKRWVMEKAGVHVHGATSAQPPVLFQAEHVTLKTLPRVVRQNHARHWR